MARGLTGFQRPSVNDSWESGIAGSQVEFDYKLVGPGWAEARFAIGDTHLSLTASYIGDALGETIAAVRALLAGEQQTVVSWWEEPGEYRWLFTRSLADVDVRILWFDELWTSKPMESGRELFRGTCSLVDLVGAIADGATAVLKEWGEAGYRREWIDYDFPRAGLDDLSSRLREIRHDN